eukprot:763113-Hanusia_phi.AAC.2
MNPADVVGENFEEEAEDEDDDARGDRAGAAVAQNEDKKEEASGTNLEQDGASQDMDTVQLQAGGQNFGGESGSGVDGDQDSPIGEDVVTEPIEFVDEPEPPRPQRVMSRLSGDEAIVIEYFLLDKQILVLQRSSSGDPMLMKDYWTNQVLWQDEFDTRKTLDELLQAATALQDKLIAYKRLETVIVEIKHERYGLTGSLRNLDNPEGQPIALVNLKTGETFWTVGLDEGYVNYDKIARHACAVGKSVVELRLVYLLQDKEVEEFQDEHGNTERVVEKASGNVLWDFEQDGASESYLEELKSSFQFQGFVVVEYKLFDPPAPKQEHTTMDLWSWQVSKHGERDLLFTHVSGRRIEDVLAVGTALEPHLASGKSLKQLRFRAKDKRSRDMWVQALHAAQAWAMRQNMERERWFELSHKSAVQAGGVASTRVLKIQEDQLDAYRRWCFLLLEYDTRRVIGRGDKRKRALSSLQEDMLAQICSHLAIPKSRVAIRSVQDGKSKKAWRTLTLNPSSYLKLAKPLKPGALLVELQVEPDVYSEEAKSPEGIVKELLALQSEEGRATLQEQQGLLMQTRLAEKLYASDEQVEESGIQGQPVWVEMELEYQKVKTKTRGSENSFFDESFRLLYNEEVENQTITLQACTSRIFGGRKVIGTAEINLESISPLVTTTLNLAMGENDKGSLLLQVKKTPKALRHLSEAQDGNKKLLEVLPLLSLRERHTTLDLGLRQRLHDLKDLLLVEGNVYKDYPCFYNGLDGDGRVLLDGLEDFGNLVADDVFAALRSSGVLQRVIERPLKSMELEFHRSETFQRSESQTFAAKYDFLDRLLKFVSDTDSQSLLIVQGEAGSGKSKLMTMLQRMLEEHVLVDKNPYTGIPQLNISRADFGKQGDSWENPLVVSFYFSVTSRRITTRYFLYMLLHRLSEILEDCKYTLPQQLYASKLPSQDPSKLLPIPTEYNLLRLKFLNLCHFVDEFVPSKKILIILDNPEKIEGLRFDWLPVRLPQSFKFILSMSHAGLIRKVVSTNKRLSVLFFQVNPLGLFERKEVLSCLTRSSRKKLTMEQVSMIVQRAEAHWPDYLKIVGGMIVDFDQHLRFADSFINILPQTFEDLCNFYFQSAEDFCGPELCKNAVNLMISSVYGLTEMEIRMMVAQDYVREPLSERLVERALETVSSPTAAGPAGDAQSVKILPSTLWMPLKYFLLPLLSFQERDSETLQFSSWKMIQVLTKRYGLNQASLKVSLHHKLSSYFWARLDPELALTWTGNDYRSANSLINHLLQAQRYSEATKVLMSFSFIRLCVHTGRVHELCTDLVLTLSHINSPQSQFKGDLLAASSNLLQLQRFFTASAEMLLNFPQLLVQTMVNEPTDSLVHQLAYHHVCFGWEGQNWLKQIKVVEESMLHLRTIRGHKGWIRALSVTHDGQYVVSVADDSVAKFWTMASGACVHELQGHRSAVTAVDISSNGLRMITASIDTSVKLWEIRSGIELANLYVESPATCCKFSPDGNTIIAGTQKATVHVFDAVTFREKHVLSSHKLGVRACSFTNDGAWIFTAGSDAAIMTWDVSSFNEDIKEITQPDQVLRGHSNGLRALTFNPRFPNQFASSGDDCKILIWSLSDCSVERHLKGHEGPVFALSYTPSGLYILSTSYDASVRVWDPLVEYSLFEFSGHQGPVYGIAVSIDEYVALSSGADGSIRTWNLRGLLRDDPSESHSTAKKVLR